MNYYQQRGGFLQNLPQVTKVLLIINVSVFAFVTVFGVLLLRPINYTNLEDLPIGIRLWEWMTLKSIHSGEFEPYQLITHMFAHGLFRSGGGLHILFNMYFGLIMFGKYIEETLGPKRFSILYFASGLGAAALQLFVNYIQGADAGMVGASGAIMGIFAAFAVYYPNVELYMMFIPIPIKAKYMLPIMAVLSIVLGVSGGGGRLFGNVAHFAHLGGAIVGFLLTFFWKKNQFRQY